MKKKTSVTTWKKILFDTEVAPNFFCVTFMDWDNKEKVTFEISKRKNQKNDLTTFYIEHLVKNKNKSFLIGFNSEHYDIPILNYLLHHTKTTLQELDDFSALIINDDQWHKTYPKLAKFKYPKKGYISLDLYLYWARMTRLAKKISLKALGIQLGYHTVQELPYEPNTPIPINKFDDVIHYNRVHDLDITYLVMEALYDQIKLRANIEHQFKFKCMSKDATKIGIGLLRKFYANKNGYPLNIAKDFNYINIGELILPDIKFTSGIKPIVKTKKGKDNYYTTSGSLLNDLMNTTVTDTGQIHKRVVLKQPNGMLLVSDFGSGGIHGTAFKGVLVPKPNEILLDLDYGSYYPSLLEMLHCLSSALPLYSQIKKDRIKAKHAGDKIIADTYKLVLNSIYGLLGNEHSGIKNLKDLLGCTINGQLILQMLTEELMKLGVSVVYQNTDGLTCIVPKGLEQHIIDFAQEFSQNISPYLIIEEAYFSKMVVKDVNNFLNITTSGKVKKKGSFLTKKPLGDSVNFMCIPKALEDYYVNGISPEQSIRSNSNVHDFCASLKSSKKFQVYWDGVKQQRLNRFYCSTKGAYLYKTKDNISYSHMMKESGVKLLNNIPYPNYMPLDIDYSFYIRKTNKIIQALEPNQLKLF